MKHKTPRFLLFCLALLAGLNPLWAQFPNNPCVGPNQRTALVNLQKSVVVEGSRAGQLALTDTCGNQYYQQYVEIDFDTLAFVPPATGNTSHLSEFVIASDSSVFYIDWHGQAIRLGGGGSGPVCDADWLVISDNSCPDELTDSLYKYNYIAVGARLVWPDAEVLVCDSSDVGIQVISGKRNARLAVYDNQNETWSAYDQGGDATRMVVGPNGSFYVSEATGTPENFSLGDDHFVVDVPNDDIYFSDYPNSRGDTSNAMNFLYTTSDGKLQSKLLSAILGDSTIVYNLSPINPLPPQYQRSGNWAHKTFDAATPIPSRGNYISDGGNEEWIWLGFQLDTGKVINLYLADGTGGIYKSSGDVASGCVATIPDADELKFIVGDGSMFNIAWSPGSGGDPAILVDDSAGEVSMNSPDGASTITVSDGLASVTGPFAPNSILSPATIASNQNNYSPAGLTSANGLRLTASSAVNITGMLAQTSSAELAVWNIGSNTITLKNESGSSTAANRFALPADVALLPGAGVMLKYDGSLDRWVCLSCDGGVTGAGITNAVTVWGSASTLIADTSFSWNATQDALSIGQSFAEFPYNLFLNGNAKLRGTDIWIEGPQGSIDLGSTGNIVTDLGTGEGLKYAADYSATFTDESLVTKRYVDNAISGSGAITGTGAANFATVWSGPSAVTHDTSFAWNLTNHALSIGQSFAPTGIKMYWRGATRFDLGSDATGDIYYRNASGNLTRLGIGSNGQVLTLAGGLPSWGASSLTNWTESFTSSTANTSSFTPLNAATNVNAAIVPKGTGALTADIPDGTSTGGNARGNNAVDLQQTRGAASMVASGSNSTIAGGTGNTASANNTTVAGGSSGTASGTNATVGGGITNSAAGANSIVPGGNSGSAPMYGQLAHAASVFLAVGDAQAAEYISRTSITGTAQTELFLDGSAAQIELDRNLSTNRALTYIIKITAVTKTVGNGSGVAGDVYSAVYTGAVKKVSTTTSLVGTPQLVGTTNTDSGMSDAVFTIDVDDTTEALRLRFTPPTTAGSTTVTQVVAVTKTAENGF